MMVTSGSNNQYLQPDYINSLPYDSKKSPLALLAETCRNIGADTSTIKLPTSDLVNDSRKSNDSLRSVSPLRNGTDKTSVPNSRNNSGGRESNIKCSFKPYEESITKRPHTDDVNVCDDRKHSRITNSSSSAPSVNRSPSGDKNSNNSNSNNNNHHHHNNSNSNNINNNINNTINNNSNSNNSNSDTNSGNKLKSEPSDRPNSNCSTSTSSKSGSCTAITYTTNGFEELTKNHPLSQLGLSNAHKSLNCNGCLPTGYPHLSVDNVNKFVPYPSLSPYLTPNGVSYANHLASGHCASPNICRDAFCAGCRVPSLRPSVHCPAGCTQCSHGLMGSLSAHMSTLQPAFLPTNAFYPLNSGLGKPNICSWMVGGTFCGKSFQSSDELLQHLRTHASSVDPATISSLSLLGHYPNFDPMLTSPIAGLRRTAFDPVNRYHPYKPFSG